MSAFSLDGHALYQPPTVSPLDDGYGQYLRNIIIMGVKIIVVIIINITLTSQWSQLIPSAEPSGVCNAIVNELKLLVTFCPIRGVVGRKYSAAPCLAAVSHYRFVCRVVR
jgi:hypothetical protein